MEIGNVYFTYIQYEDIKGGKVRPALLVAIKEDRSLFLKITSNLDTNVLHYNIEKWKECGLSRPSALELSHIYDVNTAKYVCNLVGTLCDEDKMGVAEIIKDKFFKPVIQDCFHKYKNRYKNLIKEQ